MKSEVNFTQDELLRIVTMQKKMIEAIAENTSQCNEEKIFHMVSFAIMLTISNFLNSYGIKKTDKYMKDLSEEIEKFHDTVRQNASYMEYKDGKKISEGHFQ